MLIMVSKRSIAARPLVIHQHLMRYSTFGFCSTDGLELRAAALRTAKTLEPSLDLKEVSRAQNGNA